MLSMKSLIRFLDRGFIMKVLLVIMLYSLVPFGEFFLLLFVREYIGAHITMAAVAGTALIALVLARARLTKILGEIHGGIKAGEYPEESFDHLAGLIIAAILLLTPGFVSDLIGLLLFIPLLRKLAGRLITSRMRGRLKELYEYIKLYDL